MQQARRAAGPIYADVAGQDHPPLGPLLRAAECHHPVCCIQTDLQAHFNWMCFLVEQNVAMDYQSNYSEFDVNLDTGCLTLLIKPHLGPCSPPSTSCLSLPREEARCWASWSTPATPAAPSWSLPSHSSQCSSLASSITIAGSLQEKPGTGCLQASAQLVAVDVGLTEFSAGLTTRRCCTGAPRKPPQSPPQLFPFFLLYVSIVLYSFCNDVLSIIHLKHLTREIWGSVFDFWKPYSHRFCDHWGLAAVEIYQRIWLMPTRTFLSSE